MTALVQHGIMKKYVRSRYAKRRREIVLLYAIVSKEEALQDPFPYVHVNNDASFRELTDDEKEYLQEEFRGSDGGRPYVKSRFWQLTPDDKLHGFLARKKLPRGLEEGVPAERIPWWKLW